MFQVETITHFTDEETEIREVRSCAQGNRDLRSQPNVGLELQGRPTNASWGGPEVFPERVIPALSLIGQEGDRWGKGIPSKETE